MNRIRRGFWLVPLVLMAVAALPAAASPPALTPADRAKLQQLVEQLGDRSFRVRETAAAQIVPFGRAAEPFLRDGLRHPDPEVRTRCARLLPIAMHHDLEKIIRAFLDHKGSEASSGLLSGWDRFKELAGADETARELFVDLHRIDHEFLESLERDPADARAKMAIRCQEFMHMRNFGQSVGTPTQVAMMLFAVLHPKLKLDAGTLGYLSSGLYTMSFQPRGKELLKENASIRKLLVHYLMTGHQSVNYQNMYLVANLELKEGVEIAKRYLKTSERDSYTRSMAIAILGKIGSRSDIPDLVPFLESTASIGSVQFGNGKAIHTQLRDVALASLVLLSGQNLADYDFAYLKMFNNQMGRMNFNFALSPGMLGFSDDATRNVAITKWREWYDGEKKKK